MEKETTLEMDKLEEKVVSKKSIIREYVEAAAIALVLALFVRTFVIQAFKIPSGSMLNTLLIGDHILVNKFIYGITVPFTDIKLLKRTPNIGDVIVFKYPEDESRDFIKRVVANPGDKFEIREQKVYINDHLLEDKEFAIHSRQPIPMHSIITGEDDCIARRDNYGPVVIPENKLFMMGDNRENSKDSRCWGFLDINKVKGKAFIIYWSWDSEASNIINKVRWNRFGKLLH